MLAPAPPKPDARFRVCSWKLTNARACVSLPFIAASIEIAASRAVPANALKKNEGSTVSVSGAMPRTRRVVTSILGHK